MFAADENSMQLPVRLLEALPSIFHCKHNIVDWENRCLDFSADRSEDSSCAETADDGAPAENPRDAKVVCSSASALTVRSVEAGRSNLHIFLRWAKMKRDPFVRSFVRSQARNAVLIGAIRQERWKWNRVTCTASCKSNWFTTRRCSVSNRDARRRWTRNVQSQSGGGKRLSDILISFILVLTSTWCSPLFRVRTRTRLARTVMTVSRCVGNSSVWMSGDSDSDLSSCTVRSVAQAQIHVSLLGN